MLIEGECAFCQLEKQGPGPTWVYEDGSVFAVMDIRPIRPGHVIVIPRRHAIEFLDWEEDLASHVLRIARRLGWAQRDLWQPVRVCLLAAGFEMPHAHLHVVPMQELSDLTSRELLLEGCGAVPASELATQAAAFRARLSKILQ